MELMGMGMTASGPASADLDSLRLINELCNVYDRRLAGDDENSSEMVRIIRAVLSGTCVVLSDESQVARALREELHESPLLWAHVTIEPVCDSVH